MNGNPEISPATQKLVEFTRAYHTALEAEMETRGRHSFPYHGEPVEVVATFKASDGFATFYLPSPPDDDHLIRRGHLFFDCTEYDLNTVCESVSIHRLKVASPMIGEPWNVYVPTPSDTEGIPGITLPWFHEDVRQAAMAGQLTSLPAMMISPIVNVKDDIRREVAPSRIKIWAPTFNFPGIGRRRLYLWTHADFWWFPDQLDLDPAKAATIARTDLLALATVQRSDPEFTVAGAQQDSSLRAADLLDEYCDELLSLLEEHGNDEEVLHQWLYDSHHWIFLEPDQEEVRSKVPFGSKVSDFVVRRSDGTYALVEIEPATARIFQRSNSEPTAVFNHACLQVSDWQRYIRDNVLTVRAEQNLEGIYEPQGMVIIGRTEDINTSEARVRWLDMKSRHEHALATYDEICNRVRALANTLRTLLRS